MSSYALLDLTFEELTDRLSDLGQPAYRAEQIWHAVFEDLATSYDQISTLPMSLRQELQDSIPWPELLMLKKQTSADRRTIKLLHQLPDNETIESVLMRYAKRTTACISTQAGCAMGCVFCATGQSGFRRNLSVAEIVGQVLTLSRLLQPHAQRLSNVVFMGMGEPLDNYDATLGSIRILNDPRGLGLGARSFTISTVGIIPGIERLAQEKLQVNLAVSLHAADNDLRTRLVPINRRYPVVNLLRACRAYVTETHRRVTFEMALMGGINDSDAHAHQAAAALRGILCHINLIAYNATDGSTWQPSSHDRMQAFADILEEAGFPVTVRQSRGADIRAACGQLRAERKATR
jgi:23S rRNA (adenine2503-C2)-methyltransferase